MSFVTCSAVLSIMFALEMLGWGFFVAFGALALAPLFRGRGPERGIRWTLVAFGAFSLVSVVGYATETVLSMAGFVAWGPLLLALAIMLALFYRRQLTVTSATPSGGA